MLSPQLRLRRRGLHRRRVRGGKQAAGGGAGGGRQEDIPDLAQSRHGKNDIKDKCTFWETRKKSMSCEKKRRRRRKQQAGKGNGNFFIFTRALHRDNRNRRSNKNVVKETGFCHKEIDSALYVRRTPVGIGGTKERSIEGCRVYDQCLLGHGLSSVRQEEGGEDRVAAALAVGRTEGTLEKKVETAADWTCVCNCMQRKQDACAQSLLSQRPQKNDWAAA